MSNSGIYKFNGFYFYWNDYTSPYKLKKDLEPAKKEGMTFFKTMYEFSKLSDKQKRKYLL